MVVVHYDCLQAYPPARRETLVEEFEVRGPPSRPDSLDHLDADYRIERALHRTVVLDQHIDLVFEPRCRDAPPGQCGLLLRQRDSCHPRTPVGGPERQFSPAGANFQEPASRTYANSVEEPVDLAPLRDGEGVPRALEQCGGVGHRLIEEQGEQVVRQVVVPGYVAPGTTEVVVLVVRVGPLGEAAQGRNRAGDNRPDVPDDGLQQADQVRRVSTRRPCRPPRSRFRRTSPGGPPELRSRRFA